MCIRVLTVEASVNRVVSSEISGPKFPEISGRKFPANYSELTYVSQLFPCPTLQSDAAENKHVLNKQLSISLRFNFMHYVQKNNLF